MALYPVSLGFEIKVEELDQDHYSELQCHCTSWNVCVQRHAPRAVEAPAGTPGHPATGKVKHHLLLQVRSSIICCYRYGQASFAATGAVTNHLLLCINSWHSVVQLAICSTICDKQYKWRYVVQLTVCSTVSGLSTFYCSFRSGAVGCNEENPGSMGFIHPYCSLPPICIVGLAM
jgi:hypothetical protein